jgi:hypothetical protein
MTAKPFTCKCHVKKVVIGKPTERETYRVYGYLEFGANPRVFCCETTYNGKIIHTRPHHCKKFKSMVKIINDGIIKHLDVIVGPYGYIELETKDVQSYVYYNEPGQIDISINISK